MVTGTKITAVLSLVGNTTYRQHRVCVPGVHALPVHQRILCYQYGCNIAKLEWYLESLHISQSQAELLPTVALVQHGKSFNKPEKQWVRALLLLSRFSRVRLCATPQTAAHQAPPSLGFSRQEHWSGLPFPSPMHESEKWKWSRSVVSDSSRPHGLQPTRLLQPWDFPGKSSGVGCHKVKLLLAVFSLWV